MIRKKKLTVYVARVRDSSRKMHGGKAFRVRTASNLAGQFGTRKWAEDALNRALANNGKLVRVGVAAEKILVNDQADYKLWLAGDVKDPSVVPYGIRPAYIDTLNRAASAAREYGHVVWVNESYRSEAEQQHFIDLYHAGGSLAAPLGRSPHQRGIGLDIPNARTTPKLIKALRRYQLIDDVPSEIWHVTNHAMLKRGF